MFFHHNSIVGSEVGNSNHYDLFYLFLSLWGFPQVKRCAEMSRKLRFFKDQISKAGLLGSVHPVSQPDIELEELEVYFYVTALALFFLSLSVCLYPPPSEFTFARVIVMLSWNILSKMARTNCTLIRGAISCVNWSHWCCLYLNSRFNLVSTNMSWLKWTLIAIDFDNHIMSSWSSRWYYKRYFLFYFLSVLMVYFQPRICYSVFSLFHEVSVVHALIEGQVISNPLFVA